MNETERKMSDELDVDWATVTWAQLIEAIRKQKAAELITVCGECLTASCWQGIFMCDEARNAGTVQKTREELRKLGLEHPSYWKTDDQLK